MFSVHEAYPATILVSDSQGPEDTVVGEVYEVLDESIIPSLDAYEGFPHLYTKAEVITEKGHFVTLYTYNQAVEHLERVPLGNWRNRVELRVDVV